jgi:D-tyrosyl-tRNA(Tyr) deacylase
VGEIGRGFLVLLAAGIGDKRADADWMLDKILHLRVFPDDDGRFNRSLDDVGGSLLVVSQFTLYGDCQKGRRPSFSGAMEPEGARRLYEYFCARAHEGGAKVATGVFGATMEGDLVNTGPVTLILDSPTKKDTGGPNGND